MSNSFSNFIHGLDYKNVLYYAGVGSRKTPKYILKLMSDLAITLEKFDLTLNSGGADGADEAFGSVVKKKKIYIPWKKFNNNRFGICQLKDKHFDLASTIHPMWDRVSSGGKKLHARNTQQILGKDLDTPVSFVVCFTPNGKKKGGTATAMQLAENNNIPIFNMGIPETLEEIKRFIKDTKMVGFKRVLIKDVIETRDYNITYTDFHKPVKGLTVLQNVIKQNRKMDTDPKTVKLYENATLSEFLRKETMKDSVKASKILEKHIKRKSRILLVSDYDVDGIGSIATLYSGLAKYIAVGCEIIPVLNQRRYGNGVNDDIISEILGIHEESPVDLIITSDHGSADDERYHRFKDLGIELIVTDHHIVPGDGTLRQPDAFMNPQRPDCGYDKGRISGCVVAFILLDMTAKRLGFPDDSMKELYPILAMTTISDMMDLGSLLNRRIVEIGLRQLNISRDIVNRMIVESMDSMDGVDVRKLSFGIIPIINSAGRIADPTSSFLFLISQNRTESMFKLKDLIKLNIRRKRTQARYAEGALEQLKTYPYQYSTVITLDRGAEGIQGIIAGNVGELRNTPVIALVKEGEKMVGSGRGIIENYNIKIIFDKIMQEHPGIVIRAGGHAGAAGCTMNANKVEEFKKLFDMYSVLQLSTIDTKKTFRVECDLSDTDIEFDNMFEIAQMGPYGKGYEAPYFIGEFFLRKIVFLKNNPGLCMVHFKLPSGTTITGLHRYRDREELAKKEKKRITIVYSAVNNYFMGSNGISLDVKAIL